MSEWSGGGEAEVGMLDGAWVSDVLHWNDDTGGPAGLGKRHMVWAC